MKPQVRDQLPFIVGLAAFALLAIFNEWRGFALWRNYALSGILLGTPVVWLLHRLQLRVPHYIQWVIVAALLSHYGGGSLGSPNPYKMGLLGMHGVNGAYHHFDWWDHLTHFLGIGAGAMGIAYLLEVYQMRRGLQWSPSSVWILTLMASMAAGVLVELYEYLGKTAFQTIDQGGYENTMRDLHFNFIGAALGGGIAVSLNRTRFRADVEERWGIVDEVPADAPWWRHTTPAMMGFTTLCAIPALTALYLMTEFFAQEIPPDDLHLYDPALLTLTIASAVALVAAPVAGRLFAQWRA